MISLRAARQLIRVAPSDRAGTSSLPHASRTDVAPAARWAAVLFVAIGLLALSEAIIEDPRGTQLPNQLLLGSLGVAIGLTLRRIDWNHWHDRVLTGVVVVAAYALVGVLVIHGSLTPYSHAGLFILVSV